MDIQNIDIHICVQISLQNVDIIFFLGISIKHNVYDLNSI